MPEMTMQVELTQREVDLIIFLLNRETQPNSWRSDREACKELAYKLCTTPLRRSP